VGGIYKEAHYEYEVGYLCPDCNAEYESLIKAFIGGSEEE